MDKTTDDVDSTSWPDKVTKGGENNTPNHKVLVQIYEFELSHGGVKWTVGDSTLSTVFMIEKPGRCRLLLPPAPKVLVQLLDS